jgi:fumarylacetoacetase
MTLLKSWVDSANSADTPFPLNNLPYGVFSTSGLEPRCGVAIGDMIVDMQAVEEAGLIELADNPVFDVPYWNDVMELGPEAWDILRARLTELLGEGTPEQASLAPLLVPMAQARMELPIVVAEYTDFYAGKHHATNVGTMFRGAENALPPNWLHIPIGNNGRASSVVVSGTQKSERGSLLELSWGGKEPLTLDTGETRTFIEDGDTLTLSGAAQGDGYRIGFGTCTGTIKPAPKFPA